MQARGLMQLNHPHILPIRDMGLQEHEPFLVSDDQPYWTLREIYPRGSRQPLAMFLPHLKALASALSTAHAHGIAHGDLRPENILLTRENVCLLSGFVIEALVRNQELHRDRQVEAAPGESALLAPEQASPAGDQYWLAVLVYELLCGTLPSAEAAGRAGDDALLHLRQSAPDISPQAARTLLKALEKNPEQRFADIAAFVSALEEAQLAAGTHKTSRPGQPEPMQTPAPRDQGPERRRQPAMTRRAFAVGVACLAVAGGAGGWYLLTERLSVPLLPTAGAQTAPATRTTVDQTDALIFTGHLAGVNAVAWSPDGTLIASASDDTTVQVFRARDGRRTLIYSGHTEEVVALGWSPGGHVLASGGQDASVQVWRASTGARTLLYRGHTGRVNGLSWSRDGRSIASGSEDKSVQVWNADRGDLTFRFLGHTAGVLCVGWQPDNSSVASGSWDGTLRDWAVVQHGTHFAAGDEIFRYSGHGNNEVNALAWSPDGSLIASAGVDQTVQISRGTDGIPVPPFFTRHKSQAKSNSVLALSWSPDGRSLASGDSNGNILVWQANSQKVFFRYSGHGGAVNALAWSPDGKTIASAGADNTVQVWQPGSAAGSRRERQDDVA